MGKRGGVSRFLLGLGLLCALLAPGAAAVDCTEQAAAGDTVYVAGNPDWYPVEYYDPETKCFEGILPAVLDRVQQKTGLEMTYLRAGQGDQRQRMAENGQVELVSGCLIGEEWLSGAGMEPVRTGLRLPTEQGTAEVCLVFTEIADPALKTAVTQAVEEIAREELPEILVGVMQSSPAEPFSRGLAVAVAGSILVLAASVAVLWVKLRRRSRENRLDALHDGLTGMGNKAYFQQAYETKISERYRSLYCVIFTAFDIVRVNQYYGEAEAEEQLRLAAGELQRSIGAEEFAARVSGGGFAVIKLCSGEQDAAQWTLRLLERLNGYNDRFGKDYRPDFQAGVYLLEQSDRDCERVLFNARQGYQRAVSTHRPCVVCQTELLRQEREKLQLKKEILDGFQNREFCMYLQLIVDGKTGRISGAEAVSRWNHPKKGLLYPGSYVELMEKENTIGELDLHIFEEVCRQLEHWYSLGWAVSISCNFSRQTICASDFVERVREIVERYRFPHDRLIVEITEDTMESNRETAFANVSACKELGFHIALDDAGSGYTSFSDLRDYPIDVVKIDRSILTAAVDARGMALLRGMVALAHSMAMQVLCEGVETAAQAAMLKEMDCDFIQGYYYYRPMPTKEAERILRQERP